MVTLLSLAIACSSGPPEGDSAAHADTSATAAPAGTWPVRVRVTLDGVPADGVTVLQGGNPERWTTDHDGFATVEVDPTVVGDLVVLASHPDARIDGVEVDEPTDQTVPIDLVRFDPSDNPAYVHSDPGTLDYLSSTTADCVHCHVTIHADWWESPHRTAASNPTVHDVYGGTAAALDEDACASAGGAWGLAREPGTGAEVARCVVDGGVAATGTTGACADCHAPGLDGELGGRDLLEATGTAYDDGVHCEVCHHVESVDLDAPAGVAGRLRIVRPSEESPSPSLGIWHPLTFGPFEDVPNPRMGSVARTLFHEPELCAGCHQLDQEVLVPDTVADPARWPDGRLPIHSTYAEWSESDANPRAPCQSCHMPPDPSVGNAADLYNVFDNVMVGISAGWERPPGEVRHHGWYGPRQRDAGMLELAAALKLEKELVDGELVARATVENVGSGHALPTGEPMRSMVLLVEATCAGEPLAPTGGDAVPDVGGWLDRKEAGEDWTTWPGAEAGDVLRFVRRTGAFHDYDGYGPFGDGTFDAAAKGMPVEEVVGVATVVSVDGDVVTLDAQIPDADVAYRGRGAGLPEDGEASEARAGAPGFAFARVLAGADGARSVPHHLAVDVASDNRLLPGGAWTTEHRFAATCADPDVRAVLIHRAYPPGLAEQRGWTLLESVMAEAWR